ncbi:hypothetical protein OHAE_5078 [Ochrobactrum soli]|uniref:Uncharacterized protein n=1 Tax=Ochrobactrum soli TaxID=2448455 RepID=A0A2P9HDW1_9HYPH|nr:hypothetical protein OHAE_5078 [[Ochrobactrum] soli]
MDRLCRLLSGAGARCAIPIVELTGDARERALLLAHAIATSS